MQQQPPETRRQPPVAPQHLRQLVQHRAVSGDGDEPLPDGDGRRHQRLFCQNVHRPVGGEVLEKKTSLSTIAGR
jgi:hypothetical protein